MTSLESDGIIGPGLHSRVLNRRRKSLRQALALSVERGSIRSVLLQGAGQPTASVLPNWMSGYGFVFPIDTDLPRARQCARASRARFRRGALGLRR